jgi:ATP phosphoribosyltransferase regulatory subunit
VTAQQKNVLRLPQGTESFHLGEALRHRRRLRRLEERYASWGYLPVETPVFDFYDVYAGLMTSHDVGRVYRLIDREGELLMLRSDATLFLAKQLGLILQEEDLPVRVYYADTILRHQDPDDIAKNEFVQTGVELIGASDWTADAEVMLLLWESLQESDASDAVIHLGSRRLVNAVSDRIPGVSPDEFRRMIQLRDYPRLRRVLAAAHMDADVAVTLERLFGFIGTSEELEKLRGELEPTLRENAFTGVTEDLEYLRDLAAELTGILPAQTLRVDLSEVGMQTYYTGVVFRAYIPGTDAEIASGGRYDELLALFGFNAPSVGFSILPGKIDAARRGDDTPAALPEPAGAGGTTLQERYEDARRRRAAGETVRL